MSEKPEALRLADALESGETHDAGSSGVVYGWAWDDPTSEAAAELRRLHADNERLRDELRQSGIDHTRAEVERLKGLLRDWREFSWSYRPEDWRVRINEALQEPPR